jgi:transposase-like protein
MKSLVKPKALNLRRGGYSLKEIASRLGVAKSTASVWVKSIPISESGYNRLRERTERARAKANITIANRNAKERSYFLQQGTALVGRYFPIDRNTAKLLAAILYWCEGGKSQDNQIKFTNSDPELIKFFLGCLRTGFPLREEKLRCLLHLHGYHDVGRQTQFWSNITSVPVSQFHKPYLKPNSGKNKKPDYPGCITVGYYDKIIAREVFGLIKALIGIEI